MADSQLPGFFCGMGGLYTFADLEALPPPLEHRALVTERDYAQCVLKLGAAWVLIETLAPGHIRLTFWGGDLDEIREALEEHRAPNLIVETRRPAV